MRQLLLLVLLVPGLVHGQFSGPGKSPRAPSWHKYSVLKVANGSAGCTTSYVGAVTFTGAGLNDGTSGGTYSGTAKAAYSVEIDKKDTIATIAAAPTAGGAGYSDGDVLTLTTGGGDATVRVTAQNAGVVTAVELVSPGTGYAIGAGQATAGGTGVGATIAVSAVADTFKWNKDAGAYTTAISITGAAQTLSDGVTITFAAAVGHTVGNKWDFTATEGCWRVNNGSSVAATDGLNQSVVLFSLPARGAVENWRVKTSTACAGVDTISVGLGTTGNNVLYHANDYNLKTAVAATNLHGGPLVATGSDTAAATNVVASVVTTVLNIPHITAGCAFDIWVLWGVLQ